MFYFFRNIFYQFEVAFTLPSNSIKGFYIFSPFKGIFQYIVYIHYYIMWYYLIPKTDVTCYKTLEELKQDKYTVIKSYFLIAVCFMIEMLKFEFSLHHNEPSITTQFLSCYLFIIWCWSALC